MYCNEKVSIFNELLQPFLRTYSPNVPMTHKTQLPNIKLINTIHNPMNPGFDSNDEYTNYRLIIKKVRSVQTLDGLDINDKSVFDPNMKKSDAPNLFAFDSDGRRATSSVPENFNESEFSSNTGNNSDISKPKKRQSSITLSNRMLKKADNLTKFNRKNHSEGNKHITNNDL